MINAIILFLIYISVDTKSIKAIKKGNYREVYQARRKLEKEGFRWSEKQEFAQ